MRTILLALLFAAPVAAQSASDNFDRPNSTSMGADWNESNGAVDIDNNQAKFASPWSNGFMYHTTLTGNYADSVMSMDFTMNGFGGDNVGMIAGLDPNTWGGVHVKLQDNNGDGLFDRVFFNAAFNAGNWNGSSLWFDLVTPVASGTMTLSFSNAGDTADVEISSAGGTETFSGSGILTFPFPITGNQFGIGGMGDSWVDNWSCAIGPQGPSLSVGGTCGVAGSSVELTGATPNGTVVLASGTPGAYVHNGGTCNGLPLGLAAPNVEAQVSADANGDYSFSRNGMIPAGACGAISVQAVDVTTCVATAVLAL